MTRPRNLWPLFFSNVGHFYIHFFTAFYFVIVLSLEGEWGLGYSSLIELWTLGAILVGAAALPAGWLGDRWSGSGMMAVFFIGTGGASICAGYSQVPWQLLVALAGIGLFASIYHPVGIPWLMKYGGRRKGRVLAINGIFGTLGAAGAGLIAGYIVDIADWRMAFIVPGMVSIATGLVLVRVRSMDRMPDSYPESDAEAESPHRVQFRRVFVVLVITMFLAGIIYHTTQASLPKLFSLKMQDLAGDSKAAIGTLVALVYGFAGFAQLAGGFLADRFALKPIYLLAYLIQIPLLMLASKLGDVFLLGVAAMMVMVGVAAIPAENMLLARYSPSRHHGLVFGIKFVLSFGGAPVAVQMVSLVSRSESGVAAVFMVLSGAALISALAALMLPGTIFRIDKRPAPA